MSEKLINSGPTVSSQDDVIQALTTIGYYRLKGYIFDYIDSSTNQYKNGTNLTDILELYSFDSELSHLLFNYISKIEVSLKARLVQAFQLMKDPLILHDPSEFKNKQLYWRNQNMLASEISRSNDLFIKHHFNKHEGAIPLWASVEVMSFGTLSKTIKNMRTGPKTPF